MILFISTYNISLTDWVHACWFSDAAPPGAGGRLQAEVLSGAAAVRGRRTGAASEGSSEPNHGQEAGPSWDMCIRTMLQV